MDVPLHQHWQDIHVRRWLIVLTALVASLTAYFASLQMTPVYEAKTTFFLATGARQPSFVGPVPDQPQAPLFPVPEEKAASLDIGILRGVEIMSQLSEQTGVPRQDLERQIDVTVSGEFMIDLFVRDPDPDQAADIANRVPELYANFHNYSMRARAGEIAETLGNRVEALRTERAELRAAMRSAREDNLSTVDNAALARLEAARDEAENALDILNTRIVQVRARQSALKDRLADEAAIFARSETIDTTSTLDFMLQRVLDLRVDLAAVTDGPASPRRRGIEDQIAEIEAAMEIERQRLADSMAKPSGSLFEDLRLELALTEANLAELTAGRDAAQSDLTQTTARFGEILAAASGTDDIATRIAEVDLLLASLRENLASARLQAANASAPLLVVSQAEPPERPAFPLPVLNAVVAGLCGLLAGTYYALWLAYTQRARKVATIAEIELPSFTDAELAELRNARPSRRDPDNPGGQTGV